MQDFIKKAKLYFEKHFFKMTPQKMVIVVSGVFVGFMIWGIVGRVTKEGLLITAQYIVQTLGKSEQRREVIPVEVHEVHKGEMSKKIKTIGRLVANNEVTIRPEISSVITKILFKEGASVKKGDVLLQFENAALKAELEKAQASYALAKVNYERIERLHKQNFKSTSEKDKNYAEMAAAEANVAVIRARLAQTEIVAPFEGVIGLISFGEGAFVQAGTELVKLVDSDPMKVEFKVPEQQVNEVGEGQTVEIHLEVHKDEIFKGTVFAVDSQVDAITHSVALKASIPNESGLLKSGQYAEVWLITGTNTNAILIPESAIARIGENDLVWIVKKGVAEQRRIITGSREGGKVEVLSGLVPGDLVITSGQIKIQNPGTPVRVTKVIKESEETAAKTNNAENKKAS